MIEINSSCARVDLVNALASQLKLQVSQPLPDSAASAEAQRKLQDKLDAVDQAVKSGDPQKAEQALFEAQSAVWQAHIGAGADSTKSKAVDLYA